MNNQGEIVDCPGQEIDDVESVFSTASIESKRKRKRTFDDMDLYEKVEELVDKLEDIGVDLKGLKNEVAGIIAEKFSGFKMELELLIKETVRNEIKKINNEKNENIKEIGKAKNVQKTYAEKAKNAQVRNVVIEPKEIQDSIETFNEVKRKVKLGKIGVGVETVKRTQNGKVVIGCKERKGIDILATELKSNMGDKYNIKITDKKLPKVKIVDVEDEILDIENEEEIFNMIIRQNDMENKSKIKMSIKRKFRRNKQNGMMIIEVDPETHKFLVEKQRIKLGWNRCRVFDCVSVLRCFKCWGYYHFAKECKNELRCRKCAGNHIENDCKSNKKLCVNCDIMAKEYKLIHVKTDHYANDVNCECYVRVINRAQKNINYYSK